MPVLESLREMPQNPHQPEHNVGPVVFGQEYINGYREWIKEVGLSPKSVPYIRDTDGRLVNEDGSEIRRDVKRERRVFGTYLGSQPRPYQLDVQTIADSLPPMTPSCRIAVQIPTYNEGKNIYSTLKGWADQRSLTGEPLDTSLYEINLINNGPQGYRKDNTLSEVERFRKAFQDVKMNVIDIEFPTETGNVGMARKFVTDVILQRSIHRSSQQQPLYVETEDADIFEIDNQTLANRIHKFDNMPYLDGLAGQKDFSPKIIMQNDYLLLSLRARQIAKLMLRGVSLRPDKNGDFSFYNRVVTGGWNTAFTAEAYALADGYLAASLGEDHDLGRRIAITRGSYNENGDFIPNTNTVEACPVRMQSSPRRYISAVAKGASAYGDFAENRLAAEVRDIDPSEMVLLLANARISEDSIGVFNKLLTKQRKFLSWNIKDPATLEQIFKSYMVFLGFGVYKNIQEASNGWLPDYEISENGSVEIKNIDNLKNALNQFRKKHSSHT